MEKRTNGTIEELSLLLKAYQHNTRPPLLFHNFSQSNHSMSGYGTKQDETFLSFQIFFSRKHQ